MNLPNILTVVRLFLTIIFIFLIYKAGLGIKILAAVIFWLAAVTDFLDGYIAKKYNLISSFGKIMDPIADKFLILSAFYVFMDLDLIYFWMFAIILVREAGLTIYRLWAYQAGRVLAAEKLGKYKTVAQVVVISMILIFLILYEAGVRSDPFMPIFLGLIDITMVITVILTVVSGISYFTGKGTKAHV